VKSHDQTEFPPIMCLNIPAVSRLDEQMYQRGVVSPRRRPNH
jgi:hypothetical protein